MRAHYDIVIVGGGMVGNMLACALGDTRLRVALIESEPAPAEALDEYDVRVSAITLASRAMFENVAAWEAMLARRVSPLREMRVWDSQGDGVIDFDAAEIGEAELGYIIENRVIVAATLERLRLFENVDIRCPAAVSALHPADTHIAVELQSGERLTTALVVGADGAHSSIREWAGIHTRGWSYRQTAIVATVKTQLPHRACAYQAFLPTGPLAFLPLNDGLSSIVWSCDQWRAEELLRLGDQAFMQELSDAFGARLGAMESVSRRVGYPLSLAHSDHYIGARVALVGDAAHRVHPLAGQGVNLGLLDAASLTQVLLEAAADKKDIGTRAVLRRYERWRKGDNLAMLAVTDAFKRGFGSQRWPLVSLRNAGMQLADRLGPVKQLIMRHAAGLDGDLPLLARCVRRGA
jgi:2-octaprenylphenol hydroxylase